MKKTALISILYIVSLVVVFGQKPYQRDAAEIELGLRKLNFLGSVLYVAAHPDDENTRLIAYLSNEMLANTAYLSMTRGDGGQNLIGPEIREYLGIIRTQELLAARRVDGGRQFFTRANDFGYSKNPEETQKIWEREDVLKDVIRTFRKFQPDVIITRFPIDGRGGHGHHTTSAILAQEAFKLAGDKGVITEDLSPWSPKRLYLNTGRWWNQTIDKDSEGVIYYNMGKYNPLLGSSYSEIAAVSRTQHKSQGFGSTGTRGEQLEFLEHKLGAEASKDIFDGVNTSWSKLDGGESIEEMIKTIINDFQSSNPASSVPKLLEVRKQISKLKEGYWKSIKLKEVESLIKDCLGLYLEVKANDFSAVEGQELTIVVEGANRSEIPVFLNRVMVDGITDTTVNLLLNPGDGLQFAMKGSVPERMNISQPYWLEKKGSLGMYRVDNSDNIGKPENDPTVVSQFEIDIMGNSMTFNAPLVYKWNDPVDGEQYRPFIITPKAYLNMESAVLVFAGNEAKQIQVIVKAAQNNVIGEVVLDMPKGWKSSPESISISLDKKGEEKRVEFTVMPPKGESEGNLVASIKIDGNSYSKSLVEIIYNHIPVQTIFPESAMRLVKFDLERNGNTIGYIQGTGDDIPENLRNIGYEVWEMNDEDITPENLSRLDAVVLGIRALNTRDKLTFAMKDLLEYAENGGTLVVQYNTSRGIIVDEFSPYPLTLSRGRVSVEDAPVRILAPNHPIMQGPNKITSKDFDNWVQERGLYFPSEWDDNYVPLIASNDPGEEELQGGLLAAKYGKGYYVYTGYSWWRQLPAGVPGAYKIFTNIISLGNGNKAPNETSLNKSK